MASWLYGFVDSWCGPAGLRVLMGLTTAGLAAMTWALTRPAKSLVGRIVDHRPGPGRRHVGVGAAAAPDRVVAARAHLARRRGTGAGTRAAARALRLGERPRVVPARTRRARRRWRSAVASTASDPSVELRALAWAAAGVVLGMINPARARARHLPRAPLAAPAGPAADHRVAVARRSRAPGPGSSCVQVVVAIVLLVRRPSYRAAVPLVMFTAAALLGVRNVAVASLVIVPGMAYGLAGLGSITGHERRGRAAVAAVVVISLLGGLLVVNATQRAGVRPAHVPRRRAGVDRPGRLDDALGQRGHPGDGRQPARAPARPRCPGVPRRSGRHVPGERRRRFPDSSCGAARAGSRCSTRMHIDVVVWDAHEPLTSLLAADPAWRIPYNDGRFVVACRRDSDGAGRAGREPRRPGLLSRGLLSCG